MIGAPGGGSGLDQLTDAFRERERRKSERPEGEGPVRRLVARVRGKLAARRERRRIASAPAREDRP
jgi:hypothetical protein